MNFVPLTYRIAKFYGPEVRGYAFQMPAPLSGLRFCVRWRKWHQDWVVDHYDSGHRLGGPLAEVLTSRRIIRYCERWHEDGSSREAAAQWAIRYLRHVVSTGRIRKLMPKDYHWCLDEAGIE